jgi:hypothetical protein
MVLFQQHKPFTIAGFMEQFPPDQPDFIPLYFKTRQDILRTSDPVYRLTLMEAAISEGDGDMAAQAFEALRDLPDAAPGNPDMLNPDKFIHAIMLAESLAHASLFEEGDRLVGYVRPLDMHLTLETIDAMLWRGHTGPDDAYLKLAPELIGWADIPPRLKLQYTARLAAYGHDVLDPASDARGLFDDCLPSDAAKHEVDHTMLEMCRAYANTGQFERAAACADFMRDPYWRQEAALVIARTAHGHGKEDVARTWLARGTNLSQVASCDPSCGRPSCNPPADVRALRARAAVVHALRGEFSTALNLLDPEDPLLAPERRAVYVIHYEKTGNMASRESAIRAITAVTDPAVTSLVDRMFTADIAWGNTMPSLEAADESIPVICWELHEMYARLSMHEERLQAPGADLERTILENLFNVPLSTYLEQNAAARAQLRDQLLAEMVKRLAPDAPHTARALLELVESHVEKSRTIIAVGRQMGYEGFSKSNPDPQGPLSEQASGSLPAEKETGALGSTPDMVLRALKRLLDTFRHRPPD